MKHLLNQFFDKIYVVNLERRPDRLFNFSKQAKEIGFEFEVVNAIDGASRQDVLKEYQEYQEQPLGGDGAHALELSYNKKMIDSVGAWAYLKTYELIFEESISKGYEKILCFDDDVIFDKDFNEKLLENEALIKEDWKLFYLGATQHLWVFPNAIKYPDDQITAFDNTQSFYHPLYTDGSFAVGIDSSVFKLLLAEVKKYNCSFDSGPMRRIMQLYQDECIVLQPNIVIADVSESDIRGGRNQIELSEKLHWPLENFDFEINYPLVTVVMPCYNAIDTVIESVNSILNQSYPNVEIIITDECSTYGSAKKIEKHFGGNKSVTLIKNKENKGCYFSRNEAVRVSRGDFVAIQDADDYSLKDRIMHQVTSFYTHDIKVSIGSILRAHINPYEIENLSEKKINELAESRRVHLNDRGLYEYCCKYILGFMTTMYKRSVFNDIGLFWEDKHSMDMEFLERLAFDTHGKLFKNESQNIHTFLSRTNYVKGLYKRTLNPILYSFEMNTNNITNAHKTREGNVLIDMWRKRLDNQFEYDYPILEKQVENNGTFEDRQNYRFKKLVNSSFLGKERREVVTKINKTVQSNILIEDVNNRNEKLLSKIELLESEKIKNQVQINYLKQYQDKIEWYSETYDHLPLPFLKIGAIFRRVKVKKGF
jgi:glycosyltransferase involved in cell wall biosynthesis